MECKTTFFPSNNCRRAGMTLVEIMVAMGLGSLVLLVLGSLTLYSARSFSAMVNYTDLNKENRLALDQISKEIRQSRGLLKFSPTSLIFNTDAGELSYTYDPDKKAVLETKGKSSRTVLKNCTSWTNEIFQRNPQEGKFEFIPTTDPATCKMVQISWTCASEAMEGQNNTDDVLSMKVVIRKKPD